MGHPKRRARVLLLASMFVFTLIVAQLFRIQGLDAATLAAQAVDSRLARTTIPAMRGTVTDDNGTVLAQSVERRNVAADPVNVAQYKPKNGKQGGFRGAADAIAAVVGGKSADMEKALQQASAKHRRFVYLAKDISPDQWNAVLGLGIPGITSERVVKRQYPQQTSLAPLLGWIGANGLPGGGVESMEQSALAGKPGTHTYEVAPDGTMIATGDNSDKPAVDGKPVKLTIDNDVQWYAQNAIAGAVAKNKALAGYAVVMDVKGNLKAVASYPSFDNNDLSQASASQMQSLPFTDAYEPGSTSKVITLAALLQQKAATPASQYTVPNRLHRAGATFKDSEEHGTEQLTLAGVLAKSSNIGTTLAGEKLSPATLYDYLRKFGMGTSTGVGYPGETAGLLTPYQQWNGSQRYTVMFGQGLSSNAIAQASVFQTIANGGVREPAKLIAGIGNGQGGFTAPADSRTPVQVISPSVAQQMTTMMAGVISKKGTADKAAVPGYNVAGKTGTAERYDQKLRKYSGYTASFIGFAPAEAPRYIVAVVLERPTAGSIYGGDVAAPVFSDLMGYVLHHNNVPPSNGPIQEYPLTWTRPEGK